MFRSRQRLARLGLAIFAGFGLVTAYAKEPVMSETKTYCIGRFLVDVPKEAEINGQSYEFMIGRVESERVGIDAKGFATRMEKREEELKAGKQKDKFKLTEILSPTADSRIFKLSRAFDLFPNDPPSTGLEAYRLSNGTVFSMAATGFNKSFPDIVERLKSTVLPSLRYRQSDEVPAIPGFCIKDGFIADDGTQKQREDAGMSFHFARWPDVVITVSTSTVSKAGEKTLLQRLDSRAVPPVYAPLMGQIKTLRRGVHEVQGRKGEEILELLPAGDGIKQHSFRWEVSGNFGNVLSPDLIVEFESGTPLNGNPRRPSLSDEEATKLFDSIVNSVRLRPTGPAKVSGAEPAPSLPQAPLGAVVATGSICPQTGWWQCIETGNIDGGRRRFFKAGEAMPAAVLLGDTNIWQSLRGQRPSHSLNTVWSLVAYEETEAAPVAAAAKADTDNAPGTSLPGEPTPG